MFDDFKFNFSLEKLKKGWNFIVQFQGVFQNVTKSTKIQV